MKHVFKMSLNLSSKEQEGAAVTNDVFPQGCWGCLFGHVEEVAFLVYVLHICFIGRWRSLFAWLFLQPLAGTLDGAILWHLSSMYALGCTSIIMCKCI